MMETILKANQKKRNKCIVYTRCIDYHKPVESFNVCKKREYKKRIKFKEKEYAL